MGTIKVNKALDPLNLCYLTDISADDDNIYVTISAPMVVDEGKILDVIERHPDDFPMIYNEYTYQMDGLMDPDDKIELKDWLEIFTEEETNLAEYLNGYIPVDAEEPYIFKLDMEEIGNVLILPNSEEVEDLYQYSLELAKEWSEKGIPKSSKWQIPLLNDKIWLALRNDLWGDK